MLSSRRILILCTFSLCVFQSLRDAAAVDSEQTYQGADISSQFTDHQLRLSGTDRYGNSAPTSADELDAIRQHTLYADYLLCTLLGFGFFRLTIQGVSFRLRK